LDESALREIANGILQQPKVKHQPSCKLTDRIQSIDPANPRGVYDMMTGLRKKGFAMTIEQDNRLTLRPLERHDLKFVHELNNNAKIMRYWFTEPYETFAELSQLYDRHVHDQRERRFVAVDPAGEIVGLVELIGLDHIHRYGEFQIIIAPQAQGRGYATSATRLAIDYAFSALNLHKLYLVVDRENATAIHIYEKCGFQHEAELIEEFFYNGNYYNVLRMCMFQRDFLARRKAKRQDSA
jgi:diamine N-acetyltransferase